MIRIYIIKLYMIYVVLRGTAYHLEATHLDTEVSAKCGEWKALQRKSVACCLQRSDAVIVGQSVTA
jgi:hypothetical protein